MPRDRAIDLLRAVAALHGGAWTPSDSPRFGANALCVNGKMYAALTRKHRLLLKLPAARVAELLKVKRTERFESGGRMMNGWITLAAENVAEWIALADEACTFVAAESTRRRK